MYSSFRLARRKMSDGKRCDWPVANSSCVYLSANVLITDLIVMCHVTIVNSGIVGCLTDLAFSRAERAKQAREPLAAAGATSCC